MANPTAITLHESGAETATDTGDAEDLGATRSCLVLDLVVTAVAGTLPTLTVAVQTGPSETGPWRSGGAFSVVSATGKTTKTIAGLDRWVRLAWTIAGSAGQSFTFSVDGTAHTLYASPADLTRTGVPEAALTDITDETRAECCLRASADAETALNSSHELPLTAWGEDLRGHTASRAVYYAMNHRGRKPGGTVDDLIDRMGGFDLGPGMKSAAQRYFDAVANGTLKPHGIVDQTPDTFEGSGVVVSGTRRGW